MRIVMTLMVRDEADIVEAMLEHHFSQGVDHIVATDNGSIDGTREILERFARRGILTLHHDPRHKKQQSEVVTSMAREAARDLDATWVLNADADEFWVAEDRTRTLRQALQEIPTRFRAFDVPVVDMTGEPALEGSGLGRLVYRDLRPSRRLQEIGLHAHATHNVAHVADENVTVAQGNHFVNIPSCGRPSPSRGIEVLHVPWRSWRQFERKVRNAGEAYERSSLEPSPNHHGMRDFRRLRSGSLYSFYLARHPSREELALSTAGELEEDRRLAETLADPVPDAPVSPEERRFAAAIVGPIAELEREVGHMSAKWGSEHFLRLQAEERAENLQAEMLKLRSEVENLQDAYRVLAEENARYRDRRAVRVADAVRGLFSSSKSY